MNAKIKRSMTLTITGATRDMHDKVLDHTLHNLLHTQSDDGKKNHTKLKSDNTNRKERKSNAKKKEKGGGRRTMSSSKECTRLGRGSEQGSRLMANNNTLVRLTHPRRLPKRTIVSPSKQDVQYPN